jgi:RNA polymerase sigma factor (sigma-70 family)
LIEKHRERAAWVAREVIPYEARVRAWLRRSRIRPEEIDDLIQETYCRLAMLDSVSHIESPYAYFFSTARSLLIRLLKRRKIVSFEAIAEAESMQDDRPSVEDVVSARLGYGKLLRIMQDLPDRRRQIVQLRKIDGWSQRQIAEHLGTTEKAIEKQIWLGIRAIREAWSDISRESEDVPTKPLAKRNPG